MPTWDEIRRRVNDLALSQSEWAGYPLPIESARLVLEPRYPLQSLNGAMLKNGCEVTNDCEVTEDRVPDDDDRIVNSWFSQRRHETVFVGRRSSGKARHVTIRDTYADRFAMFFDTLFAANEAWDVNAELVARDSLAEIISPQQCRTYTLTGAFIERSARSGIFYVFRKLRPTVACRCNHADTVVPFVALCLHPIGYYEGTWAGAMVPSDDVMAHLVMMRGDERKFWAKANHIPLHTPNSGL